MTRHELPPELHHLEQDLAALIPAGHLIDANALVFEAGRQAILAEPGRASQMANTVRQPIRFAFLGSLVGTAATLLMVVSLGRLEMGGTPGPENLQSGRLASVVDSAGRSVAARPATGLPPGVDDDQRQMDFRRVGLRGRTTEIEGFDGSTIASHLVLSTIGFVKVSPHDPYPVVPPEQQGVSTSADGSAGQSAYWQLRERLCNGPSL